MPRRLGGSLALVAFALCLVVGIEAGNSFTTAVGRALLAMAVTFFVGLAVGAMGQAMIEENLRKETAEAKKTEIGGTKVAKEDR